MIKSLIIGLFLCLFMYQEGKTQSDWQLDSLFHSKLASLGNKLMFQDTLYTLYTGPRGGKWINRKAKDGHLYKYYVKPKDIGVTVALFDQDSLKH